MNSIRDDEELLERLRAICAQVDPVPEPVYEAARAAFGMRRLDAELADLVKDSLDEAVGPVAVRAAAGLAEIRMLSFAVGPLEINLQVTDRSAGRHLVLHWSGVELSAARLETATEQRELDTEDGVLIAERVTPGRVRFVLTAVTGHRYATTWILV
jgi:hypothetical protein